MRKLFVSMLASIVMLVTVVSTSFAESPSFVDINKSYAKDAILELQSRGIINGIDATHFNPKGNLTRAEFVAIIVRALGLKADASISSFTDVSGWSIPYVEAATQAGIITGIGNGKFAPNGIVTREMAATILVRALQTKGAIDDSGATLNFTDANKIAEWAKEFIAIAQKYGLIKGYPNGIFNPKGSANREMAAIMGMNLLTAIDQLVPPVTPTPSPEPTTSPEPTPTPTPAPTTPPSSGGGGGGGGGGWTPPVNPPSKPPQSTVEFLSKQSFVGAFTSDFKVKIDGSFIDNYSLYYDGELVGETTNGIVTSVNNVFSNMSKIKIRYNSVDRNDSDAVMGTW